MARAPALWMIGASMAFACMAACIKLSANHQAHLTQIIFFRGLISFLWMMLFMGARKMPLKTPHFKAHLLRGCAGFAAMLAYVGAIAYLPLATAVTLNYTSPLILGAMLLFLHHERPSGAHIAAMLTGLLGIVMLCRPVYDRSQWLGGSLALLSALLGAFSALNIRMLGRLDEPPARTVLYFSLFIMIAALPSYLLNHPTHIELLGLAYACVAASFATLGQWMITVAYQRGNTLLMSLLGYSQVVFTTLFGIALWHDALPFISRLGIALIIGSGTVAMKLVRAPVVGLGPRVSAP